MCWRCILTRIRNARVGAHIRDALSEAFTAAQMEMEKALGNYTVANILEDVLARAGSKTWDTDCIVLLCSSTTLRAKKDYKEKI